MEKFLADMNINTVLMIFLALAWAYNIIYQAFQNGRRAVDDSKKPFQRIDGTIADIRNKCEMHVKDLDDRIDNIERRLGEHDKAIKDLHDGQSVLCRGVQALLDHALHNGNDEEMKQASDGISKWLRTR